MTPNLVSREDWLKERVDLLEREKAFTRERDALSAARRELPRFWAFARVHRPGRVP